MIQLLTSNDVLASANLMSDTWNYDSYKGYERDEGYWIAGLIDIISNQAKGNKNYLAIKDTDSEGNIKGFMTCTVYNESYSGKPVLDVRDMIVDYTHQDGTASTVTACFDYMIEYAKAHGCKDWRADTIHSSEHAIKYVKFLSAKYDGNIRYGFRGTL